ncbi:hypothetical protein M6D93_15855 [Jatrophihabitans telluris]|uniref:Uncharacterized protein n=1 Tax=Jatrophihabitans telluris TaxID=2038343 RepID=A0ABY4QXA8_9ACTN|nr:hypothetical protein [Jatrophihabitans telluris]UQX87762.1 hypothetical protein M6D93_15855 [Jatrophihabitans telluris]
MLVALLACGCGSAPVPNRGSGAAGLTTCGDVPRSSGRSSATLTLTASTPGSGAAGTAMAISATLSSSTTGGALVSGPSSTDVLLIRDGHVVGRDDSPRPELAALIPLRAGHSQRIGWLPETVLLSGCPAAGKRSRLPAGQYELVVSLRYTVLPSDMATAPGPAGADSAAAGAAAGSATGGPGAGQTSSAPGVPDGGEIVSDPVVVIVR